MENKNQQEIIEVTETKRTGVWESVKHKVAGMSKKSIVLLSVGALAFVTAGFVAAEVYENKLETIEDQIERQFGFIDDDDDDDDNQQVMAQTNSSSVATANSSTQAVTNTTSASQLAENYGVKLVDTSELDGTYTATSGNDTYTMTVKGNQATLTEVDNDGDQDIEQVIFDLDKKIAYIDGEANTYTLSGSTLTLTEIDTNDTTLDKLTFAKQ